MWSVDREDVEAFRDLLVKTIVKSNAPKPIYAEGSHCRWCRAKPKCPQLLKKAVDAVQHKPTEMDVTHLADAMELAKTMEHWCKEVFAHAKDLMDEGTHIPGYKLVEGRKTRNWVDEEEIEKFLRAKKILVREMFPAKIVSPAQAEKVMKKHNKDPKVLADFIISKSSGTSIAPEDDKRPAIGENAAFAKLAEAG
jgi:hypothetical protein